MKNQMAGVEATRPSIISLSGILEDDRLQFTEDLYNLSSLKGVF